jgi:hypothetical protein
LLIVSPILIVFAGQIENLSGEIRNVSACLVTLGLIMEQGMLLNETATKLIDEKVKAMIKGEPAFAGSGAGRVRRARPVRT